MHITMAIRLLGLKKDKAALMLKPQEYRLMAVRILRE